MLQHLPARCAILLFVASLAAPAKALETLDADVATGSNIRQDVADSGKPKANEIAEGLAVGSWSPPVPARWAVRAEAWGTAYRWSLTNGSLVFDLTVDQTHHGSMVARDSQWDSGLRQTGYRRHALALEGPARSNTRKSFIDKLGVGWTPAPSRDPLPRRAWDLRLGESDRMVLRLRRGVLTIFAQRAF